MASTDLILQGFGPQLVIKAFLILFLVFYFFFSFLLIRQVQTMAESLKTNLNNLLKLATFINLLFALIFLVVAFLA